MKKTHSSGYIQVQIRTFYADGHIVSHSKNYNKLLNIYTCES
jgi:hypothetical protein